MSIKTFLEMQQTPLQLRHQLKSQHFYMTLLQKQGRAHAHFNSKICEQRKAFITSIHLGALTRAGCCKFQMEKNSEITLNNLLSPFSEFHPPINKSLHRNAKKFEKSLLDQALCFISYFGTNCTSLVQIPGFEPTNQRDCESCAKIRKPELSRQSEVFKNNYKEI